MTEEKRRDLEEIKQDKTVVLKSAETLRYSIEKFCSAHGIKQELLCEGRKINDISISSLVNLANLLLKITE